MFLKTRFTKRLILPCIAIYLAATFFIVCIQTVNQNLVHHYTFDHFILRLIMCCILFMYVYLQKTPNTKFTIIPPFINRKKLIMHTVLLTLTFYFCILENVKLLLIYDHAEYVHFTIV